jgi:hypothetical protein
VNLFLDASVVLAACGRRAGASHAIFDFAPKLAWHVRSMSAEVIEQTLAELTQRVAALEAKSGGNPSSNLRTRGARQWDCGLGQSGGQARLTPKALGQSVILQMGNPAVP